MSLIKVLYVGPKYDQAKYGGRLAFEQMNFWEGLSHSAGVEASGFFYDERTHSVGQEAMRQELLATVKTIQSEVILIAFHKEELSKETIAALRLAAGGAPVVGFFCDDDFRFFDYTARWLKFLDWAVTFYPPALDYYRRFDSRAIYLPWGVNPEIYKPQKTEKDIAVSFVGSYKPVRQQFFDFLKARGIEATVYGNGWPNGLVTYEKMTEIFNRSKINLHLDAPPPLWSIKSFARFFVKRTEQGLTPDFNNFFNNIKTLSNRRRYPKLHARPFEVLACEGFLITSDAAGLKESYQDGKEIVIYRSAADLYEKIKYYLNHGAERERIAKAGYERTIRDHTWQKRFTEIFSHILAGGKRK